MESLQYFIYFFSFILVLDIGFYVVTELLHVFNFNR